MDPRVVMGDLQEAMVDLPVVTEAPQVVMGDLQAGPQVHKSKFKTFIMTPKNFLQHSFIHCITRSFKKLNFVSFTLKL